MISAGFTRLKKDLLLSFFVVLTVFLTVLTPGVAHAVATLDPTVCSATIDNNPANPSSSPIVKNDVGGAYIGVSTNKVLNSDEDSTDLLPLPFKLDPTSTDNWSARAEANGAVSFDTSPDRAGWMWTPNTTFNLFLADLDSTNSGGVFLDTCVFTINGQQYDGVSATWAEVPLYRDSATITAQLIVVKTSDDELTVIRNYQTAGDTQNVGLLGIGTFTDNALGAFLRLESNNVVDGPDVSSYFMAGSGATFDTSYKTELLDGGASALSSNWSSGTSQIGRYVRTFPTGIQATPTGACHSNVTKNFKVTYSAPRVYAVDPSFTNVTTETFDNYAPNSTLNGGEITPVGTFKGYLTIYPAGPLIGAGGTGNGAQVSEYTPSTFTPTGNTCNEFLGFWWSAGNATNYVELLDARNNVIATFTAADLYRDIGDKPDYFGNPLDQTQVPNEAFAYVNIRYPAGFTKFRFSGSGFELDNISLSPDEQTVASDEVLLSEQNLDNPPPAPLKPVVSNMTFSQNAGASTFNKPNYQTDGTVMDAGWFLCDTAYNGPASYDLSSTAPSDCTFTDNRAATYTATASAIGKYIAYWVFSQNNVGNTFAIQTASVKYGDVKIVDLTSTSAFSVSDYSVIGHSTTTGTWYRCDAASSSSTQLPAGTCTATNSTGRTYTPTLADLGKYMVFKVHAQAVDSVSTDNQVVGSSQAVAFADLTGQYVSTFNVTLASNKTTGSTSAITLDSAATADSGQWWICNQSVDVYSANTFSGDRATYRQGQLDTLASAHGCTAISNQTNPARVPVTTDYKDKYLTFTSASYYSNVYILRSKSTLVTLASGSNQATLRNTFNGFLFEKAKLSDQTKDSIATWLQNITGAKTVSCVGYTGYNWYHRSVRSLQHLAYNRASNVCNYIKSLNPSIRIVNLRAVNESSKRSTTRRVTVILQK